MKRRLLIGLVCAIAILCVGTIAGAAPKHRVIGTVLIADTNPHCMKFEASFRAIVEGRGDKAIVLSANYDPSKLVNAISDLITQKVDGIVLESCDNAAPVQIVKEAVAKGIPVAASDVLLNIEESEGILVSQTVSDNYGAGVLCAKDFIKRANGKEMTFTHIILKQNTAVCDRVQGFLDTLSAKSNFKLLEGQQPMPETQEQEMAIAEAWAQKYDKLDGVFGGGDPIAIAFMRGLQGAGRKTGLTGTLIYGVDGNSDAYKAIKNSTMTGTAKQQPDLLASIPTNDIYAVLDGKKINHPWLTHVPVIYVDKTNVDKYMK